MFMFFKLRVFIFSEFEPYSHSVNLHDSLSIGFRVFRQDPNLSHTKMNGNAETFDHFEGRWRAYTGEGCGNRDELNEGGSNSNQPADS